MSGNASTSPKWSDRHLRQAIEAAGVALWSWNLDTDRLVLDDKSFTLWGLEVSADVSFEDLSARIHPADLERVRAAFEATRQIAGPYEIDFRIMFGNEIRWISTRGNGGDSERDGSQMFGIFLDVTYRKQAEEANELLAGEMSHRVKNLLTIATSLTAISSRSAKDVSGMAEALTQRLSALGRANDLVRPKHGQPAASVLLADLISVLLSPYEDDDRLNDRIRVSVPRVALTEPAPMALALVIHELATNALKYGALSEALGSLHITAEIHDDELVLVWMEHGGPPVAPPEEGQGFGSRMVRLSVTNQLGGTIDHDWNPKGLIVTLRLRRNFETEVS